MLLYLPTSYLQIQKELGDTSIKVQLHFHLMMVWCLSLVKPDAPGNVLEGNLGDPVPGSTGSDADLVAAINPLAALNDAVAVEFDFVPNSTQITFNYLFASEEYSSDFPCGNFSDGFALLLKKIGDPTYTNLAILPAGAGPVSVTNIVPAGNGFSCGPINAAYFGGMNTANIETNFNGRTIPLTATATVIPGQAYHFKMVLADASDSSFDSAVFIQGGSFDIRDQFCRSKWCGVT